MNYRELGVEEAERIREINAEYFIKNVWRKNENSGEYELVEIAWQEEGLPNGIDWHIGRFKETILKGGKAFGCFEGERLIAYATLNSKLFGLKERYVLLDQLFVSDDRRHGGIGKKLVELCKAQAKAFGAEKIFLCAGSSEETIAFYKKLGCKAAAEINEELFREDPRDIQLELMV